jgi:hypothetical protein
MFPDRRHVAALVEKAGCPAFLDQAVLSPFDYFCWR